MDRSPRLTRRHLVHGAGIVGFGLLAGCGRWPGPSRPSGPPDAPRIGVLATSPRPANLDAFRQGLMEQGYSEGHTIVVEYRSTGESLAQLTEAATELVRLPVALIVASSTLAVTAAQRASSTLPIVMVTSGDPIGTGFIASLARPGGHITGTTQMAPQLSAKRLQALTEIVPDASRVVVLWNPTDANTASQWRETRAAAEVLGVRLESLEVHAPNDFDAAFDAASPNGGSALLLLADPLVAAHLNRVVDFAAKSRLPAMYPERGYVEAGGLMAYGPNVRHLFRRAAYYVDRILKGAQPADLPVEQPREFDFIINAKTAQALGLTIPHHVLLQATEVIQ